MRSNKRMAASLVASFVVVALLLYLVLISQVAMAVMPVLGIGGFYAEIDEFNGNQGKVYPEMGTPYTETAECQDRPMLVLEVGDATISGYTAFKDLRLPYVDDRWMTVKLDQPQGSYLTGTNAKIYTTQLSANYLEALNARAYEQGGYTNFGPNSDEFLLEADPNRNTNPDFYGKNARLWMHALVVDNLRLFSGEAASSVDFQIIFQNTSQLRANREEKFVQRTVARERYFRCEPHADERVREILFMETFPTFSEPAGWDFYNNATVTSDTSRSPEYAAVTRHEADSRAVSPTIDLSGQSNVGGQSVTASYWIRKGADSFSEPPESTEDLVVEYLDSSGTWSELQYVDSANYDPGEKIGGARQLPDDALHSNFRIRFRQTAGSGSDFDYWHIDNVVVEDTSLG